MVCRCVAFDKIADPGCDILCTSSVPRRNVSVSDLHPDEVIIVKTGEHHSQGSIIRWTFDDDEDDFLTSH